MARRPAVVRPLAPAAVALAAFAAPAAAHTGGLRAASRDPVSAPAWLFLLTGGAAVGASFLLASFVTDRGLIDAIHGWSRALPAPTRPLRALARLVGLVGLAALLVVGWFGPVTGARNLAVLLVWVVWWGGVVATAYLVGNGWPALDPFRTLAAGLRRVAARAGAEPLDYPERLGAWPSVAGLLALVWVEVTAPLADDPRLLATVVAVYGVVTVGGAAAFGPAWFDRVDPVARLLAAYGRVAPVARADGRPRLRLPGTRLSDPVVEGVDETAFVVAVLYVTTYDGLVATGPWAVAVEWVVGLGAPPTAVYLGTYLLGFGAALGAYRLAARAARRFAATYRSPEALAARFAPPLLAIAAGYHLAHNAGTVLALSPAVASVVAAPLAPPQNPPVFVLPGWIQGVEIAAVLAGHVLAVWVAHAAAYDAFPDRLQAVRSQYGVTLAMVGFTMLSLWIVSEPYVSPPFLAS
ncbi:MAG: hypothetical protein V5A31_03715 [Haloferacaceae archaeon]|jgi:hypothetical protein